MRIRSDVVKYFVGLVALLALAGGATVWAYGRWEEDTTTYDTSEVPATPSTGPAALTGPVTVTGAASAMHIEGATIDPLAAPLEVGTTDAAAGAGATVTGVSVDGQETSIEWDAGQPFLLEGEGLGLRLTGVVIDGVLETGSITLGTGAHGFVPGSYTLTTDAPVELVATEASRVTFRGAAAIPIATTPVSASGSGRVDLKGGLTTETADGARGRVAGVTLESGTFTITFTRQSDGSYELQATLEGQVTTT